MRVGLIIVGVCLWLGASDAALARVRGLDQLHAWSGPDGNSYQVGLYRYKGLFGSNPARPIVINAKGQFVAVGPWALDGFVSCATQRGCTVLLQTGSYSNSGFLSKFAPSPLSFGAVQSGHLLEGQADFGFSREPVSALDYLSIPTAHIRRYPWNAMMAGSIFVLVGMLCGVTGAALAAVSRSHVERPLRFLAVLVAAIVCWALPGLFLIADLLFGASIFTFVPIWLAFVVGTSAGWFIARLVIARKIGAPNVEA